MVSKLFSKLLLQVSIVWKVLPVFIPFSSDWQILRNRTQTYLQSKPMTEPGSLIISAVLEFAFALVWMKSSSQQWAFLSVLIDRQTGKLPVNWRTVFIRQQLFHSVVQANSSLRNIFGKAGRQGKEKSQPFRSCILVRCVGSGKVETTGNCQFGTSLSCGHSNYTSHYVQQAVKSSVV